MPRSRTTISLLPRDYLVGVFPLRFETQCPGGGRTWRVDRLRSARRRARPLPSPGCGRHARATCLSAAVRHIRPDELSIVVVGDAEDGRGRLRDAGLGEVDAGSGRGRRRVIVVLGRPRAGRARRARPGRAGRVAAAAAARGRRGRARRRVATTATATQRALRSAASGIGHAAVLRMPGVRWTAARRADIELALALRRGMPGAGRSGAA